MDIYLELKLGFFINAEKKSIVSGVVSLSV